MSILVVIVDNMSIAKRGILWSLQLPNVSVTTLKFLWTFWTTNFASFEYLLNFAARLMAIRVCVGGTSMSPRKMLAATLRCLATGGSYGSIVYIYLILIWAISRFIPAVAEYWWKFWQIAFPYVYFTGPCSIKCFTYPA